MVIAGGYGTGRELVEFFMNFGPGGGLLGMWLVSTVIWSAVGAVTFELARLTKTFEYRSFSRVLLGPAWWLYEICYLIMMIIVLSVIAAAAGSIVEQIFSLPYLVGVAMMMAGVGFLVLKGTALVEKFLSFWSLVLYAVYVAFFVACFASFGDDIVATLGAFEVKPGWFMGGIEYAAYNVGILPAVLFTIRHQQHRKEALTAGVLVGPIAIIPGFFFYMAMMGLYPQVLSETVPSILLLETDANNRISSIAVLVLDASNPAPLRRDRILKFHSRGHRSSHLGNAYSIGIKAETDGVANLVRQHSPQTNGDLNRRFEDPPTPQTNHDPLGDIRTYVDNV